MLVEWQHFNPVAVGVTDEIEAHLIVFVADAAHLFVHGACFVVVAGYAQTDVKFAFAQVIGVRMVAEPSEFKFEIREGVGEIDNFEGAFGSVDFAVGEEAECFAIEGNAALQVGHVDIEMVKFGLYLLFHNTVLSW